MWMTLTLESVGRHKQTIVMVPRPATEPCSRSGQEIREEIFKEAMGSRTIMIHTTQTTWTTTRCRCTCSSRVATKGSRDNKCNTNKSQGQTSRHIITWPLFIIKGRHPRWPRAVSKQLLGRSRCATTGKIGAARREWRTSCRTTKTHSCSSTYKWVLDNTLRSLLRSSCHRACPRNPAALWRSSLNE